MRSGRGWKEGRRGTHMKLFQKHKKKIRYKEVSIDGNLSVDLLSSCLPSSGGGVKGRYPSFCSNGSLRIKSKDKSIAL